MTENKEHNHEKQNEQNPEQNHEQSQFTTSLETTRYERSSRERLPLVLSTLKETALSLVITLLIVKSLFKTRGNWQQFTLTTGITFFPICISIIIFAIFGINKIVIILGGLSCFTMAILILNASLLNVLRVSPKQSLILTTTLTVIVAYVGTSLFNYLRL